MTTISRRNFLRATCTAGLAAASTRLWTPAAAFANDLGDSATHGTLVVLFLRGAMDGLSAVVPHADDAYYQARPTIAIPRNQVLDLDGRFGLHPALASVRDLYDAGDLALVHAAGSLEDTRSHFDAQELMERGTDTGNWLANGWLTRHVQHLGVTAIPLHAMAWGAAPPASMRGNLEAVFLQSLAGFNLAGRADQTDPTRRALEALYGGEDGILKGPGRAALRALDKAEDVRKNGPAADAVYPASGLGNSLADVAKTIKSGIGLTAATLDVGGWDLHANAGTSSTGTMRDNLANLGDSLRAFHDDLGEHMASTTVLVMSEFGRRVEENGSNGTDHGSGNCMFVLGGGINGGRVYGEWSGLGEDNLFRGDVPVLTDYRDIVGEIAESRHGGSAGVTFPGYERAAFGLA